MSTLQRTEAWILILLYYIIVISNAISSTNGLQPPWRAATRPCLRNIHNTLTPIQDQSKATTDFSCISSDPNIYKIVKETREKCKGNDYVVTFYHKKGNDYINLGSFATNKYLFHNVLMKYSNWLLAGDNTDVKDIKKTVNSKESGDILVPSALAKEPSPSPELDWQTDDSCTLNYPRDTVYTSNGSNQDLTDTSNYSEILDNSGSESDNNGYFKPSYNSKLNGYEVFLPEENQQQSASIINVNLNNEVEHDNNVIEVNQIEDFMELNNGGNFQTEVIDLLLNDNMHEQYLEPNMPASYNSSPITDATESDLMNIYSTDNIEGYHETYGSDLQDIDSSVYNTNIDDTMYNNNLVTVYNHNLLPRSKNINSFNIDLHSNEVSPSETTYSIQNTIDENLSKYLPLSKFGDPSIVVHYDETGSKEDRPIAAKYTQNILPLVPLKSKPLSSQWSISSVNPISRSSENPNLSIIDNTPLLTPGITAQPCYLESSKPMQQSALSMSTAATSTPQTIISSPIVNLQEPANIQQDGFASFNNEKNYIIKTSDIPSTTPITQFNIPLSSFINPNIDTYNIQIPQLDRSSETLITPKFSYLTSADMIPNLDITLENQNIPKGSKNIKDLPYAKSLLNILQQPRNNLLSTSAPVAVPMPQLQPASEIKMLQIPRSGKLPIKTSNFQPSFNDLSQIISSPSRAPIMYYPLPVSTGSTSNAVAPDLSLYTISIPSYKNKLMQSTQSVNINQTPISVTPDLEKSLVSIVTPAELASLLRKNNNSKRAQTTTTYAAPIHDTQTYSPFNLRVVPYNDIDSSPFITTSPNTPQTITKASKPIHTLISNNKLPITSITSNLQTPPRASDMSRIFYSPTNLPYNNLLPTYAPTNNQGFTKTSKVEFHESNQDIFSFPQIQSSLNTKTTYSSISGPSVHPNLYEEFLQSQPIPQQTSKNPSNYYQYHDYTTPMLNKVEYLQPKPVGSPLTTLPTEQKLAVVPFTPKFIQTPNILHPLPLYHTATPLTYPTFGNEISYAELDAKPITKEILNPKPQISAVSPITTLADSLSDGAKVIYMPLSNLLRLLPPKKYLIQPVLNASPSPVSTHQSAIPRLGSSNVKGISPVPSTVSFPNEHYKTVPYLPQISRTIPVPLLNAAKFQPIAPANYLSRFQPYASHLLNNLPISQSKFHAIPLSVPTFPLSSSISFEDSHLPIAPAKSTITPNFGKYITTYAPSLTKSLNWSSMSLPSLQTTNSPQTFSLDSYNNPLTTKSFPLIQNPYAVLTSPINFLDPSSSFTCPLLNRGISTNNKGNSPLSSIPMTLPEKVPTLPIRPMITPLDKIADPNLISYYNPVNSYLSKFTPIANKGMFQSILLPSTSISEILSPLYANFTNMLPQSIKPVAISSYGSPMVLSPEMTSALSKPVNMLPTTKLSTSLLDVQPQINSFSFVPMPAFNEAKPMKFIGMLPDTTSVQAIPLIPSEENKVRQTYTPQIIPFEGIPSLGLINAPTGITSQNLVSPSFKQVPSFTPKLFQLTPKALKSFLNIPQTDNISTVSNTMPVTSLSGAPPSSSTIPSSELPISLLQPLHTQAKYMPVFSTPSSNLINPIEYIEPLDSKYLPLSPTSTHSRMPTRQKFTKPLHPAETNDISWIPPMLANGPIKLTPQVASMFTWKPISPLSIKNRMPLIDSKSKEIVQYLPTPLVSPLQPPEKMNLPLTPISPLHPLIDIKPQKVAPLSLLPFISPLQLSEKLITPSAVNAPLNPLIDAKSKENLQYLPTPLISHLQPEKISITPIPLTSSIHHSKGLKSHKVAPYLLIPNISPLQLPEPIAVPLSVPTIPQSVLPLNVLSDSKAKEIVPHSPRPLISPLQPPEMIPLTQPISTLSPLKYIKSQGIVPYSLKQAISPVQNSENIPTHLATQISTTNPLIDAKSHEILQYLPRPIISTLQPPEKFSAPIAPPLLPISSLINMKPQRVQPLLSKLFISPLQLTDKHSKPPTVSPINPLIDSKSKEILQYLPTPIVSPLQPPEKIGIPVPQMTSSLNPLQNLISPEIAPYPSKAIISPLRPPEIINTPLTVPTSTINRSTAAKTQESMPYFSKPIISPLQPPEKVITPLTLPISTINRSTAAKTQKSMPYFSKPIISPLQPPEKITTPLTLPISTINPLRAVKTQGSMPYFPKPIISPFQPPEKITTPLTLPISTINPLRVVKTQGSMPYFPKLIISPLQPSEKIENILLPLKSSIGSPNKSTFVSTPIVSPLQPPETPNLHDVTPQVSTTFTHPYSSTLTMPLELGLPRVKPITVQPEPEFLSKIKHELIQEYANLPSEISNLLSRPTTVKADSQRDTLSPNIPFANTVARPFSSLGGYIPTSTVYSNLKTSPLKYIGLSSKPTPNLPQFTPISSSVSYAQSKKDILNNPPIYASTYSNLPITQSKILHPTPNNMIARYNTPQFTPLSYNKYKPKQLFTSTYSKLPLKHAPVLKIQKPQPSDTFLYITPLSLPSLDTRNTLPTPLKSLQKPYSSKEINVLPYIPITPLLTLRSPLSLSNTFTPTQVRYSNNIPPNVLKILDTPVQYTKPLNPKVSPVTPEYVTSFYSNIPPRKVPMYSPLSLSQLNRYLNIVEYLPSPKSIIPTSPISSPSYTPLHTPPLSTEFFNPIQQYTPFSIKYSNIPRNYLKPLPTLSKSLAISQFDTLFSNSHPVLNLHPLKLNSPPRKPVYTTHYGTPTNKINPVLTPQFSPFTSILTPTSPSKMQYNVLFSNVPSVNKNPLKSVMPLPYSTFNPIATTYQPSSEITQISSQLPPTGSNFYSESSVSTAPLSSSPILAKYLPTSFSQAIPAKFIEVQPTVTKSQSKPIALSPIYAEYLTSTIAKPTLSPIRQSPSITPPKFQNIVQYIDKLSEAPSKSAIPVTYAEYVKPTQKLNPPTTVPTSYMYTYSNLPTSLMPNSITDSTNALKANVYNYITDKKIKSQIDNSDINVPLGNFVIAKNAKKICVNSSVQTINPSIGLKTWPLDMTMVEAKLILKFKNISGLNFAPVVNNIHEYDSKEIENIVTNYIRNNYGDVIVVRNEYSLNNEYEVININSVNGNNKYNLLWPVNTCTNPC